VNFDVRPVGGAALLVEVDGPDEVRALDAELQRRRAAGTLPRVSEIVPGLRTILLDGLDDPTGLAGELPSWTVRPVEGHDGPCVEIPTQYDGADLAAVADRWHVPVAGCVAVHAAIEFRVAFIGFAPGFAYLTGLPEAYRVPRHPTPRAAVPAGSVGLADGFCGVYPRSTPGGWQLIGHTDLELWDVDRPESSPLVPGARVRFVPIA
jgi:KipI family sensor histidine kinase inhibitor